MSQKLIVGNWKMHGSRASVQSILAQLKAAQTSRHTLVVCPPYPYLAMCAAALEDSPIAVGAQDVAASTHGAQTGAVSAEMLADNGCRYVIVGHSERRLAHSESDAMIAEKIVRSLSVDLRPIVCIGESYPQRQAGLTETILFRQLGTLTQKLSPEQLSRVAIAYEPVWAIGSGKAAPKNDILHAHRCIRQYLNAYGSHSNTLLYGGSVNPQNAEELLSIAHVNGLLVGGASLNGEHLLCIANTCV
ncbi:triose-phosphate isomerase [Duganella qianjiadongensis]|uniref:Triosephosphate isomerase n=1 Tax=Duganella qianjiadongensis TaxID=2692176 RepID=A0ABW9VK20_9BURK|nr:triose-phosphate isomerase [Duganella qianjiadongensis]MYM37967.1 triose-phosphate isomerase [Duganella qianjiadongensis]